MKKLLLGSIVLSLFCITLLLVQISCTKKTLAQDSTLTQVVQQNKILITATLGDPPNDSTEIYICNYDGSNGYVITSDQFLPPTSHITGGIKLSPDGKNVYFVVKDASSNYALYQCKYDGHSLTFGTKVKDLPIYDYDNVSSVQMSGVY
jgi:hypothetical protein